MNLNEYRQVLAKIRIWVLRNRLDKVIHIFDALPEESRKFRVLDEIYSTIQNKQGELLKALKLRFLFENRHSYIQKARAKYPKAYSLWTEEEDSLLRKHYSEDPTIENISKVFERSPKSIELRLIKLGLIPEDTLSAYLREKVCSICEDPIDEEDEDFEYDEYSDDWVHRECFHNYWHGAELQF